MQSASESSADGENAKPDIAPAPTQPPQLINWTGRAVRDDKRGPIAIDLPPILGRIGITRAPWLQLAKDFDTTCCSWLGQAAHVERVCERGGQRWARGIRACPRLFPG